MSAFRKGDRVQLSSEGKRQVWFPEHDRRWRREGTVVGFCEPGTGYPTPMLTPAVRVLWDGTKAVQAWEERFLEAAE